MDQMFMPAKWGHVMIKTKEKRTAQLLTILSPASSHASHLEPGNCKGKCLPAPSCDPELVWLIMPVKSTGNFIHRHHFLPSTPVIIPHTAEASNQALGPKRQFISNSSEFWKPLTDSLLAMCSGQQNAVRKVTPHICFRSLQVLRYDRVLLHY